MNWPLYKSFHARGLTQAKLAALTGINRSVLARILTNEPGRGKESRVKLFPHLLPEEINMLGWKFEYDTWEMEQSAMKNNVPSIQMLCGDKEQHDQTGEIRTCSREKGHDGWHHSADRTESWPPNREFKSVPNA